MDASDSFQGALDNLVGFLPNLLGCLLLLLVGYIIAKIVAGVVAKALQKLGLDRQLHESDANRYVERVLPGASPSKGIARVVFWLIFIFFVTSAVAALKIPAVTTFMNQVLAYLPNVIVAIVIFVVAAVIAGAVAASVAKLMGDTPTGKVVATIVPALVMVIAMFMILNQLKIAEEIVTIAFAATIGALALGLALAFGLGGRDVARRLLEDAYDKGVQAKDQVRQDVEVGRARGEATASSMTSAADGHDGTRRGATTTLVSQDPPEQPHTASEGTDDGTRKL
jgi:hypothetical protein